MDSLRRAELLCDCGLVATDGSVVLAHKTVLAAASDYFKALFVNDDSWTSAPSPATATRSDDLSCLSVGSLTSSSAERAVRRLVTRVERDLLELLVDAAYGCLDDDRLSFGVVERLLPLVDEWHMPVLADRCAAYLAARMVVDNCVGIWQYACFYSCASLAAAARRFILYHVADVMLGGEVEWLRLSAAQLLDLLQDDWLNVAAESSAFQIARRWVSAAPSEREASLPALLTSVRIGLCSPTFVDDVLLADPIVRKSDAAQAFVRDERLRLLDKPSLLGLDLETTAIRPRIPHDILFAVGGWSDGAPTSAVETFDARSNRWQPLAELADANPRAYHAMVALGPLLLVIGGFDGSDYFNSVRCLDCRTARWREAAPMYVARCYVSAAVLGAHAYAVGGFDGRVRLATAERYDAERNQWTLVQPMARARSDAAVTAFNGKLYVAGGFNGEDVLRSVEVYSVEADVWVFVAEMLSARSGVSLAAVGDSLFVFGGFDGHQRLDTVERYDRDSLRWVCMAPMRMQRSNFATAVMDGRVYVIGGFNGQLTVADVECYDAANNSWQVDTSSMILNRSAVKACVVRQCPDSLRYSYHGRFAANAKL